MKHLFIPLSLLIVLLLASCNGNGGESDGINVANLAESVDVQTVSAVKDSPDVLLIDVREQWEYDAGHIPGVTLIPMNDVPNRLGDIPTDKEVIVTCRSGNRSGQIVDYLKAQGFENVHNMTGGILAWEAAGFEVEQLQD